MKLILNPNSCSLHREDDLKALITKLIVRLRASKKHSDAAHLAEYHLKDYELSGQCLIDGLFFSEAWSLSHRHNLSEWAGMRIFISHLVYMVLF